MKDHTGGKNINKAIINLQVVMSLILIVIINIKIIIS